MNQWTLPFSKRESIQHSLMVEIYCMYLYHFITFINVRALPLVSTLHPFPSGIAGSTDGIVHI